MTGQPTNGWSFFLVDLEGKRSLSDVRRQYAESLVGDAADDEEEEEDEED